MLFFGKKNKTEPVPSISTDMRVIPDAFYGGKDPAIHYEGKKIRPLSVSDGAPRLQKAGFLELFKNKKLLYIGGGIILLFFIGLVSWYYIQDAKKQANIRYGAPAEPQAPAVGAEPLKGQEPKKEEVEKEESEINAATSSEAASSAETEALVSEQESPLIFSDVFWSDSADADSDMLTDQEEEVFDTDSGKWDTDGDGYYDGQEVFNLYSPKGFAPAKIIDSGLALEYVNPIWQYRIYYPSTWMVGAVDSQSREVLFSSPAGDFVQISTFEKLAGEDFSAWFARKAQGQQYTDLIQFANRFQEDGLKRKDDLVAYFTKDNLVYVLVYHPGVNGSVPFRHIMQMMMQSFRPTKIFIELPEQPLLPSAPTSGLEAQP